MEINIQPNDIDSFVKDALIKAGIGKAVVDGVSNALTGYNSPVDEAIKREIGSIAREVIAERFQPVIRQLVTENVEKKITNEMMERIIDSAVEKFANIFKDRYT